MANVMDKRTQIRFNKMALECQSFYRASQLLWEDYNKKEDDFEKMFPCIVNCAFTCELALKAILLKTNTKYGRTHHLYTLLCQVPYGFLDIVLNILHKIYYPDRDMEMLLCNIKAVSNLFYKCRYIAECTVMMEIAFVKNLTEVLFLCEQALCGEIGIAGGDALVDVKKFEEVDQKIISTYNKQIIEAEQDALEMIKNHKRQNP